MQDQTHAAKRVGDVDSSKATANLSRPSVTDTAQDPGVLAARQPLTDRFTDWDAVKQRAVALFQLPATFAPVNTKDASVAPLFEIEKSFKFSRLSSDEDFRYQHVEPLLDQTANLLDRCIVDRAQRDLFLVEWFKLKVELEQFLRLDEVLKNEVSAGLYTLPYERAIQEGIAEKQIVYFYSLAKRWMDNIGDRATSNDSLNVQYAARQLSAWLNAFPLKNDGLKGADATYGWSGVQKTKPDHLYDAAVSGALEELYAFYSATTSQSNALGGTSEASRYRGASFDQLAAWNKLDIDFRRERAQIARDIVQQKVFQSTLEGGVLNYMEKAQPIEARFRLDFREALARLVAVRQGITAVYGYPVDFPADGTDGYFDKIVLWVRSAINWLVRFSRLDQNYVLPISLNALKKRKLATRTGDKWQFTVPQELFPNQRHVRLRGIGAAVVKDGGAKGLWQMEIEIPKTSFVQHLSGTKVTLDQSKVPQCYLGRVADRNGYRDAEVTGINALHNASPLGTWNITMAHQSTEGTKSSYLDDVQVDLHLAVRTLWPSTTTEFLLSEE
jgi:hypothetical protein